MSLTAVDDTCRQCTRGHHDACSLGQDCACETCNPTAESIAAGLGMRWEEPPRRRGPGGGWQPDGLVLDALKENAGRWARLHDYGGKTSANTVAKKQREANPGFEFLGRRVPTGSALYGRYVGPQ